MSLSTKTKKINVVISLKEAEQPSAFLSRLQAHMQVEAEQYAMILHDRDMKDDGTFKTPHIHLVADMKSAKRLSTFLGEIATLLDLNPLAVSIEKYVSFEAALQYLIHKNDTDKYQYSEERIIHNIEKDNFRLYMDCDTKRDDYGKIIDACYACDTLKDVISMLGLQFFTRYHRAVSITWDCVKTEKFRERHK